MPPIAGLPTWLVFLGPGLYLLLIASFHLRRHPVVLAGGWDLLLLAAAVAAPAIVGPLDLVQPAHPAWPWRLILPTVGFVFLVAVVVLAARPRIVVYNITLEQMRPVVAEIAAALDPAARWAGETVALPDRGVQVHLDARSRLRSMSLVAVGARTSPEAWAEFGRRVRQAARRLPVQRSPWAGLFAALGLGITALAAWLTSG